MNGLRVRLKCANKYLLTYLLTYSTAVGLYSHCVRGTSN